MELGKAGVHEGDVRHLSTVRSLEPAITQESSGFRGSVMSFADFTGYLNANYNSGPRSTFRTGAAH